ncbi:MAG TPA: DUF5675 family protein [Ohtaekwangia sp.]|uniref:DUF5675 family protein n=1 Tax=Ohtaekwangia sp. TaxID=2066019 RepID=UPI002F92CD60
MYLKSLLTLLVLCIVVSVSTAQKKDPANYLITLQRTKSSPECTIGSIFMGGMPVCFSFETAEGKVNIPAGEYIAIIRENVANKRVILELVKTKDIIRIGEFPNTAKNHIGIAETLNGCASDSNESSVKAYDALTLALKKGKFTNGQRVTFTIADAE